MLGHWRYQIGNPANLQKVLAKPARRHTGQGRNGRSCFDGTREQ
ncbi:hypothetical protein ACVWY3_007477 [Bradyrhizobium sp. USDA 4486]